MKINVRTYGDLMHVISSKDAEELEDSKTIKDLIKGLEEKIEKKDLHLLRDSNLTILVNGRNIHSLRGLRTILRDGDVVTFIPLVVGG